MATLSVGAGQAYATLSAAVAAARDGDTINVQAGTYVNDFATISKDITIVGVGGMANFVATVSPPNGKGIFVTQGDVTIQNLSFSGAAVADQNGAGIRYEGGNLVVIDSYFHDNQMGLLANADPNGTIRIVGSEFADSLGGGGSNLRHNLYVGNIASLVIDDSYFHDAFDGHQIKSRAQSTTITNSRIYDGTGAGSYSIDLPNGGVGVIRNNVIQQGANSDNPGIIHYGGESDPYAGSSLLIEDNVVVNDMSGNSGVRLLYNVTSLTATVSDNAVWGLTSGQIALGGATVSGTTFLSTHPTLDTSWGGGGGTSQANLSIAALSADKVEGQSGSTPFTFTVMRGGDTSIATSANWAVTGSSANPAAASDFAGAVLSSGTVSFAAGETSKTITVNVAGDTAVESNEGFTVALSNPGASTTIGTATASGTIRNDDSSQPGQASLSIAALSADKVEGQSGSTPFTFTVMRGGNTSIASSAGWAVTGSGANPAAAADFAGATLPSGTVSFAAGETTKTITVNVAGDTVVESNEAFLVTLSNPAASTTIGTATASGTIRNDDAAQTTSIETAGATDLDQVGNKFFLNDSAGAGPSLKYQGSDVVAGQFAAWTPLGAEKVGSGYQIAWQNGSADQYIVWTVDSNGNWKSQSDVVPGSASALQSLETTFQQDLNHDGRTGLATTSIETAGVTDLDRAANTFFLHDSAGAGPSLKYQGSDVVAGQFAAWTPIGAEKVGSGYQVVWKNGGADQYIVWTVDSNGNWKSQSDVVTGSASALQSLEPTFQQDLNADGTTGLKTTTIETAGATHLDQVANEFFLRDAAGAGPSLKYQGSDVVTGQFAAWTPLGAEKTAAGYQVAWQNGNADQYIIWNIDNNGTWKSQSAVVSGTSPALEAMESILHQDLNHDTIIG